MGPEMQLSAPAANVQVYKLQLGATPTSSRYRTCIASTG